MGEGYLKGLFKLNGWVNINRGRAVGSKNGGTFLQNIKTHSGYILLVFFNYLKVVPATFVLVCFLSLKGSTCQTRKNAFYFISRAIFILEKIKF